MQSSIQLAFQAPHTAGSCLVFHSPDSQVLLCRASLSEFFSQNVNMCGIALTRVQHLALCHHSVHMGQLFKIVQTPLDGMLSFYFVNCTPFVGVIRKLAEGALDPPVCVIEKDVEEHQSQDRLLLPSPSKSVLLALFDPPEAFPRRDVEPHLHFFLCLCQLDF